MVLLIISSSLVHRNANVYICFCITCESVSPSQEFSMSIGGGGGVFGTKIASLSLFPPFFSSEEDNRRFGSITSFSLLLRLLFYLLGLGDLPVPSSKSLPK